MKDRHDEAELHEEPEPSEKFSDDIIVHEPPKKRRNKQKFSPRDINTIASVTKDTVQNSGHGGGRSGIQGNRTFWTWFIESHGMKDVTWEQVKKISVYLLMT